jgi:glycosyltransferase involved in cell wall biosynthesis
MPTHETERPRRIAYLSLQAVVEGQDTWAAVLEVIRGMRDRGWVVDEWFVSYPESSSPGVLTRLAEMWRVQRELVRRLSDYDAVYVRGHFFAWYAARAARRRGVPVVQECNGTYEDLFLAWPMTRYGKPLFEALGRSQARNADAVVSVTPQLAEWVKLDSGRADSDVSPNGANVDAFSPAAPRRPGLPPRYATFFGQFAPWQGIQIIFDAMDLPDWPEGLPVVLVGDGALRPDVEEVAARDSRVVYLGRLPYAEVAGVVAGAAASLVPTFNLVRATTGLSPLKVYESMACGVPVVVSDTAGQADVVITEGCGLVVKPGDPLALAIALQRILADPVAASEMGRRGREAAVARHSWAARARERMAIVERTIGRGPRSPGSGLRSRLSRHAQQGTQGSDDHSEVALHRQPESEG